MIIFVGLAMKLHNELLANWKKAGTCLNSHKIIFIFPLYFVQSY